jgi:superfamily I DNA/RNA helicase
MDKVNQKQMLVLATCHAAKGGEWDKVFILNKGLMPSKYAVSREAIQQERNIMYVARTRAKKTLIYIEDDGYNPSYLSDKVLTDEPE